MNIKEAEKYLKKRKQQMLIVLSGEYYTKEIQKIYEKEIKLIDEILNNK